MSGSNLTVNVTCITHIFVEYDDSFSLGLLRRRRHLFGERPNVQMMSSFIDSLEITAVY